MILNDNQRRLLEERYQGIYSAPELGYGTVRDYCDSCDHLPYLSNYQGDLKDFQRPWTVKAILGTCLPGSSLLEFGAGEPIVGQMLSELGYLVTVVDPYDGSGNGPTEYDQFRRLYTGVKIYREHFTAASDLAKKSFDCIYSVSVLEHLREPALSAAFEGVRAFLRRHGVSVHCIDHVTAGRDSEFHRTNLIEILRHLSMLGQEADRDPVAQLNQLERAINQDLDTYYLSASGHNLWRGRTPYDEFPYRRVVSILSSSRS